MRIEDLDEFEGLTADMVRAWLRAKGWERCPALDNAREECWRRDDGSRGTVWLGSKTTKQLARAIDSLRVWTGLSLQSLLREINPRMRAGWPTEEELERHRDGKWICEGEDGELYFGAFREDEESSDVYFFYGDELFSLSPIDARHCRFWPCDAHGNKVRRGTR